MDTYIPPNIRLINPIFKRFTPKQRSTADDLGRAEPGPNAKINCLFSHRLSHRALSCLSIIFQMAFFLAHFYSSPLRFACLVSVCNWHSLNINYYETTFSRVPGSFNSDQIECMCIQNRPLFKVPSERPKLGNGIWLAELYKCLFQPVRSHQENYAFQHLAGTKDND